MPCTFAGVFYVTSKSNNTLNCIVNDEDGVPTPLEIIHWFPAKDTAKPFAILAEPFHPNSAYFIKGELIIMPNNTLYVLPIITEDFTKYLLRCMLSISNSTPYTENYPTTT
jgi:hypothetical protein